jgi:hypothetical protein
MRDAEPEARPRDRAARRLEPRNIRHIEIEDESFYDILSGRLSRPDPETDEEE